MVLLSEDERRELARILHDAAHQARASHLDEEQLDWIRRLVSEAMAILRLKEKG